MGAVSLARGAVTLLAAALAGCGGGAPLLHGAHVLGPGSTSLGAGFSATFAGAGAREALRAARDQPTSEAAPAQGDRARADAAIASLDPAVAPWVSGRFGLGAASEGGLTYTGRALRADVRTAFESRQLAVSVGAGATAVLMGGASQERPDGADRVRSVRGVGLDVPIVAGWRSTAGIVTLWVGARAGFESIGGRLADAAEELALHRWYAGPLVGIRFGFRSLHAALELDTAFQRVTGSVGPTSVQLSGVTLAPAAGWLVTF